MGFGFGASVSKAASWAYAPQASSQGFLTGQKAAIGAGVSSVAECLVSLQTASLIDAGRAAGDSASLGRESKPYFASSSA